MSILRRTALLAAALFCAGASAAERGTEVWDKVRNALFAQRPILEQGQEIISLEAPVRAEDAATVPIAIRTQAPAGQGRIRKIYLIVDNNPSPVGAVFTFAQDSPRTDLETRVRIEEYTHIRAIAELDDGRLFMASRYVKASGGCSAPAGKDQEAAMARLGKMKFRVDEALSPGRPAQAQLMISHPNNSGLAMDQLTRLYAPAHFVRRIDVSYAGKPVLSAEVDFTISENPNFRFYFLPTGAGELKAEVVDSKDLKFESAVQLRPAAGT